MRSPTRAICLALLLLVSLGARAEGVTGAQRTAVREFLDAVASGNAQNVAYAIHPAEIERLRTRILGLVRAEAKRGDDALRLRLFGPGMQLAELERLTGAAFYAALARRLQLHGREYQDAVWLAAIPDVNKSVQVVLKGKLPKDRGTAQVVNVVTLLPYGSDWKAAIPSELEAQIDDLIEGRVSAANAAATSAAGEGARGAAPAPNVPAILTLLDAADKALVEGHCEDYYEHYMSPNFRKVTSRKALDTLVKSCNGSIGTRETLLTALRIVRKSRPRYEYEGARAVYDLSGQGLPFDSFALERIDEHWYIAE